MDTAGAVDGAQGLARKRALAALTAGTGLSAAQARDLDDGGLLAAAAALGALRREVDTMLAVVAHAQAERSAAVQGADGLARTQGHGSARGMISQQTGGSQHEANRLLNVGAALAEAERRDRGQEPPDEAPAPEGPSAGAPVRIEPAEPDRLHFPEVSAAMRSALISIEAANAITRMLEAVHGKCPESAWVNAERALAKKAQLVTYEQLVRVIKRYRDELDRAGVEARAEEQRHKRFLIMNENKDGMLAVNGLLDPENAAPLRAAVDAMVAHGFRMRRREQEAAGPGAPVTPDRRTAGQMRADALGTFARHLLKCDAEDLPLAGARVVIRMTLDDLRTGGPAEIDGAAGKVCAGDARRMAAAAGVVPIVLGRGSQVLDLGREQRLFTKAQRLALIERDGGCAKCGAPPSWCDAHHIRSWADGGPTDLANGVMLCVRCHHDVHRQAWEIHATATEVWFTPPASIDPQRRRCPGGRMLFAAPEVAARLKSRRDDPPDPVPRGPAGASAGAGDSGEARASGPAVREIQRGGPESRIGASAPPDGTCAARAKSPTTATSVRVNNLEAPDVAMSVSTPSPPARGPSELRSGRASCVAGALEQHWRRSVRGCDAPRPSRSAAGVMPREAYGLR